MKRTALKRKSGPKRQRKPIPPMSAARIAENKLRGEALIEVAFRDGYECFANKLIPEITCLGRIHGHEIVPAGAGGSRTNTANIKLCCDAHNGWIHDHPAISYERGLLYHPWEKPELSRANDPVPDTTPESHESDEMKSLESAADQVF